MQRRMLSEAPPSREPVLRQGPMRQPSCQSGAGQEMPHNSAIPYAVDHFTMPCA
ncbi:hypothetical protein GQF56_07795 [Rhodobacter sphaeroides]|uniref:Uncharacterized protein n=1 Tax=Cereibacter sphaeroides (strain ATCC 17023 / DSM 158 / JCM 6121 / CCUG 31486 / LMG 2827 / NBRC 12203 / NCIMB 8253 / ATH 2.4.1.) TaxID=272943 RepID=Q3J2D1_CERS4|nr:hypothetical protein RSP_2892 [Cereibacter sphaeroides 2.4.1]AXC61260.1 hypothetical protein DQL45_07755 [Cereibacter sphaeroides 2.4.1]MVX47773.1 hypothetical protein [Cereibacter sphaeroides]QHA10927.1 hypothetical protein GQR99_07755 [Cereibacter sphaeroides]QHA13371.1 hypothetical protein GQY06_07740 [Cereibacter sphaeroides]